MRGYFLLDLGLAEFDVLARDRIGLLLEQRVGHGARILLGDVIEAGIRRGNELDLDGDRFGHVQTSKYWESGRLPPEARICRQRSLRSPKVKVLPAKTKLI